MKKQWKRAALLAGAAGGVNILAYTNKVIATSPIAYWPLADTSGATATDESGNGRNGAYVNSPTLNQTGIGDGRPAPNFPGVNQCVNVFTAGLQGAFNGAEGTIAGWFKVSAAGDWTDGSNHWIMRLLADASNLLYIAKTTVNGRLEYVYTAGGTQEQIRQGSTSATGWCHVALTWSKSADEVKAYFNGAQTQATSTTLGVFAGSLNSSSCVVGASDATGGFPWKGQLAHWAVWTSPLSGATIANLATVP